MKNVFLNVRVKCCICGQVLHGDNLNRRGDKYYCVSDFGKTDPPELQENNFQKQRKKNYDKIFKQ